ncbi:hypothetical protein [Actinoplanes solisilvae]|uniref:hypothetical protein n=1 Tax=Actinoplanes solisilvae TaxID=2486853 RepID=UPI000FD8E22D|nr:hypothetical protein [Actinoplanes solisilvae]
MFSSFKPARFGRGLVVSTVIPALVLGSGGAAVAASNTLTLTTLNRSGAKVTITATAVELSTSSEYKLRSGTAKKLPKGTYAVLTSITQGTTTTLSGKAVTVSGNTKLTVDARHGKRISLALNPPTKGFEYNLSARICSRTQAVSSVEASAWGGTTVYAIPTTSNKIAFAALGSWTDRSGVNDSFAVLHSTSSVPANPVRTFARSSLATVTVDSRRGPSGSNSSSLAVQPQGGCGGNLYTGLFDSDVPTNSKVRLSPGTWSIRAEAYAASKNGQTWNIGGYMPNRTVAAGKSYLLRFYNGAWGPSEQVPATLNGRVSFNLNEMFADPHYGRDGYNVEGGDKAVATLNFGGKVVAVKKDNGWEPDMSYLEYKVRKAGWYTLKNTATRYYPEITFPAGMLSTKTEVVYRFQAKPNVYTLAQVMSVQMVPANLNRYNKAKAGALTNVSLWHKRTNLNPDVKKGANPTIKTVTAKMSTDNGRSWRAVTVKKINGTWTAIVRNPASGAVSLRARTTYTSGAYSETSIIRAYAIG